MCTARSPTVGKELEQVSAVPTLDLLVGVAVNNGALRALRAGAYTYVVDPVIEAIGQYSPANGSLSAGDDQLGFASGEWVGIKGRGLGPLTVVSVGGKPVEDSAEGWVKFTYPAIRGGHEVEGVELHFEGGKVVKAAAAKNAAYLLSQLDSDAGARYLGEFAFGTNYGIQRFTKSILYDEKIGGTFHMALGAGYPETGSRNKSSIHWDMICDLRKDSEIRVDGELFYKNGEFVFDH